MVYVLFKNKLQNVGNRKIKAELLIFGKLTTEKAFFKYIKVTFRGTGQLNGPVIINKSRIR
jgi:hypothetical protein